MRQAGLAVRETLVEGQRLPIGDQCERLLVMEFRVRVLADFETCEEDLREILRQGRKLCEGFRVTAATILPSNLGCALTILEEL